ncbi:MAG: PQQ-binding-like beta-propeller repeat protein [Candidatus Aminicenantes bacterium]|nr:PQQ-binding-like beta-propeller repeat protein [Candidatus Aminicenantes bacterium]
MNGKRDALRGNASEDAIKMLSYILINRMKKSIGVLGFVLLLSTCSLFKAKIPPYPNGVIFPVEKGDAISYTGEIISPMRTEAGRVYLSTRSGYVYCVEVAEKKILWELKLSGNLSIPLSLSPDSLFVCDEKHVLYCVNREGKVRWEKTIEGTVESEAVAFEGMVFLATGEGRLLALNSAQGEELWTFQAEKSIQSNIVAASKTIAFGCDDGRLYLLTSSGKLKGKFDVGGRIGNTLAADGSWLYYGTDQKEVICFDIARAKERWKIKTGGRVLIAPVFDEKRAFFSCLNNVLYCLNKKNGTILWWNPIPGRSVYPLAIVQKRVIVTSRSSVLVSFDAQTGEKLGAFDAGTEFRSNPLWNEPFLLAHFYDPRNDKGLLVFIKKKVSVTLFGSPESPQHVNTQIVVTASPVGFHLPEYEFTASRMFKFYLNPYFFILMKEADQEDVVREKSEKNTWDWFADKEGLYAIGVKVSDEKEKKEQWIPYAILKEVPEVTVAFSKKSPQAAGEEIVFTATAKGISNPSYEFVLRRVFKIRFFAYSFIFSYITKETVQEKSESNAWTWNPDKTGIFAIEVVAEGQEEKANSVVFFSIRKPKDTDAKAKKKS